MERAHSKRGIRRGVKGRRPGGESEFKRVARARARMSGDGLLPDELLLQWARSGRMEYPQHAKNKARFVELTPADRVSCAKGCAPFYKAAYSSRTQPGEQPPIVRVELGEEVLAALAKSHPDKLEILREVLQIVQAGGVLPGQSAPQSHTASRYAATLHPGTETAGRA